MPSLENLKKQAKLFLRWHRERYYPVAAQIRTLLPRFRNLNDAQVLAHPFRLSDAQELVARQSGFGNWEALKKGVATMNSLADRAASRPKLMGSQPQLFVADLQASCSYFVDKLGFAIAFTYGDPPFYAQVRRDGAALNLRHVDQPVFDTALRAKEDLLSASMTVDDVKALYLEFEATGMTFHQKLRKEPWGATTFIVKDPDGNLLLFA
jgi:catechol 2,3-dioxygenase-like lactoylglutathione lyase family enzyme